MPFRRIILLFLLGPGFAGPALAADYVKQLKKEKRYQRDVY